MDLRKKTLLIMGCVLVLLFTSVTLTFATALYSQNKALEETLITADTHRAVREVSYDLDDLSSRTKDWAPWDDTYRFAAGNFSGYPDQNLLPATFHSLNINGFLIYTPQGTLVYAIWYNLTAEEFEPLPAGLLDSLSSVSASSVAQEEGRISGLLVLPEIPVLVSGEPILTSTFDGPSTGTLVMVRALDSAHIASISQRVGVNLTFTPVTDLPVTTSPNAASILKNQIPVGSGTFHDFSHFPVVVTPINPDLIQGSYALPDLRGDRSLLLTATTPRIIAESGASSIQMFLLLISLVILILGLFTLLIVDRLVLTRLRMITRQVSMIKDTAESGQIDHIPGDDELSQLASAINGMLGEITRATRRIQASEKRYRDVVNDQTELICRFTPDGTITFTNHAFNTAFRSGDSSLEGSSIFNAPPFHGSNVLQEGLSLVSQKNPIIQLDFSYPWRDQTRWIAGSCRGIQYREGSPVPDEYQIVGRDETEKKQNEAELKKYRERLEDLVEERTAQIRAMQIGLQKMERLESIGILAGGIAHDFNNLLSTILGNIEIVIADLPENSPVEKRLKELESATLRARSLTSQLLTFSRGGAPIRKLATDIGGLTEETAEFVCRGTGTRCRVNREPGIWMTEIDPDQVSQVISNLVLNGIQAMPDGGTIEVSIVNQSIAIEDATTLPPGTYVAISIHDHGSGIDPAILPRIFDPFFTTRTRGTGLGLTTSYSIIHQHGGTIEVRSEKGMGSTFTILLPAHPALSSSESPGQSAKTIPGETGSGRILIMDDEEGILDVLSEALRRNAYEVATARDGTEAIARYREALATGRPFDVIIMDLTIPGGMGGREAIGHLLQIDPDVKAVVSSGYFNDPVMSNFKLYGFSDVIPKPYKFADVLAIIRRMIKEDRI